MTIFNKCGKKISLLKKFDNNMQICMYHFAISLRCGDDSLKTFVAAHLEKEKYSLMTSFV